jgi:hypothetical protein
MQTQINTVELEEEIEIVEEYVDDMPEAMEE